MKLRGTFLFFATACGSHHAATNTSTAADAAAATPACMVAREARSKAAELDRGGHEVLALAKVDEANAACAAERATTLPLEASLLASTLACTRARALEGASKEVKDAKATCDALEAPSKGTEASMRAKMREAYVAERAKDFAKAKTLYLDAWAEHHPNARAIENAARMAGLAGDAAQARKLRDRALVEAESSEHAVAVLSDRVRVARGSARLADNTLTLGRDGKVVERNLTTGELRVLLDAPSGATTLSHHGTLAFVTPKNDVTPVSVYDLVTGAFLFKLTNVRRWAASPDDALVAVIEPSESVDGRARLVDVVTGEVKTKWNGKWQNYGKLLEFSPDASHLILVGGDDDYPVRQWDIDKAAYGAMRLPSQNGLAATSSDGHFLVYVEGGGESSPIHVRDMVANKELTQWTGRFISLESLAISNDGKTVATGSYNSLRLWDVAKKKQLFKEQTRTQWGRTTDSRDDASFGFSEDGKTMLLAGDGVATAWNVTTGEEKPLVSDQPDKNVLRVVAAPADAGVALILEDEVRIVPATGEPRMICKGMKPEYFPMIGPVSVAFSLSGKSFACAMADGWVHVFDAASWAERAVVKKGPKGGSHPVDLVFSPDDKSLSVINDTNIVTYDAATAAETARIAFRAPKLGLGPRHARFADGSIAVRTWSGSAAIFGADGAFQREVKLVAGSPMDALDDFSGNGEIYAVAQQKTLTLVDLPSGQSKTVALAQPAKSIALSPDGKSVLVVSKAGVVSVVGIDNVARDVPHLSASASAWFAGASIFATAGKESIEMLPVSGGDALTLEIDADGVVARDANGGFDARGKPELECIVGKTYLSRETCADRAKEGLVASWLRAAR